MLLVLSGRVMSVILLQRENASSPKEAVPSGMLISTTLSQPEKDFVPIDFIPSGSEILFNCRCW